MLILFRLFKITHVTAVPPIMLALAKSPSVDKYDISSLKHVLCGGAPLAESLVIEVKNRLGISFVPGT